MIFIQPKVTSALRGRSGQVELGARISDPVARLRHRRHLRRYYGTPAKRLLRLEYVRRKLGWSVEE